MKMDKEIAQLKAIGFSDDKIKRFLDVHRNAQQLALRIVEVLNEAGGQAEMGATLSIVCMSFIQNSERLNPGSGESTKELLIRTLSPMTIADIPAVH